MTRDEELWGVAAEALKQHGGNAPRHVAERVGELVLKGDTAGVATWKEIAFRLDQIRQAADHPQ